MGGADLTPPPWDFLRQPPLPLTSPSESFSLIVQNPEGLEGEARRPRGCHTSQAVW